MRIVVGMLLYFEHLAFRFQHHADRDVERLVGIGQLRIVGVLDKAAFVLAVRLRIDIRCDERRVHIRHQEELARAIDHRLAFARFVHHHQRRDILLLGHPVVVGTERRRDMHDPGTVLGGHIVTGDHPERIAHRFDPRNQRLVLDPGQLFAEEFARHPVRNVLPVAVVAVQIEFLVLFRKIVVKQVTGQHHCNGLPRIRIVGPHPYVMDTGTDSQRGIRRQRPRCGRPGHEIEVALHPVEQLFALIVANHFELCGASGILHIAVTPRLVQLVVAEARPGRRRIGLDRIAFVEQSFFIKLAQQVPQRLDVFVVVGDIGILHVDPVPHLAREALPLVGIGHHLAAAGIVVLFDRDFRPDILFGDSEFLLDAQFHGQAVGIPASLAVHKETALRLVTADNILDRAGHHVVDARTAVGRGRPLVKHERGVSLARGYAFAERILSVPLFQNLLCDPGQVQPLVLVEFRTAHNYFRILVAFAGNAPRR